MKLEKGLWSGGKVTSASARHYGRFEPPNFTPAARIGSATVNFGLFPLISPTLLGESRGHLLAEQAPDPDGSLHLGRLAYESAGWR